MDLHEDFDLHEDSDLNDDSDLHEDSDTVSGIQFTIHAQPENGYWFVSRVVSLFVKLWSE